MKGSVIHQHDLTEGILYDWSDVRKITIMNANKLNHCHNADKTGRRQFIPGGMHREL